MNLGSLCLGLVFAGVNFCTTFIMLPLEAALARRGKLPPRGEVTYLMEYWFFKYGDRGFLLAMDFCVGFVVASALPSFGAIVLILVAVSIWTSIWHYIYLRISNDTCYVNHKVTLLGRVHIVYFGYQYVLVGLGLQAIWLMAIGDRTWSPIAILGLVMGGGYLVTLGRDILKGMGRRK